MALQDASRYVVQVFVGALSQDYEALSVEASKQTTAEEIVSCIASKLRLLDESGFELAEVVGNAYGQECKERRLGPKESPVAVMLLWPKTPVAFQSNGEYQEYRFYLREKLTDALWNDALTTDPQIIRDYFYRFLYQPKDREYPDLCQLPDLNEQTLLENLGARFGAGHIYTYVGSILIAVNPFKFHPIYNPKYVKLYQSRRLDELPPHIFAIADAAYYTMLKEKRNQCIVISGESGSGKTESTNFLLHHLTALSQKGSHASGVEQTILSAGPVLEAFGNAKTAHNNNSSRFGKFIQVNYKENGMVHGAIVQKYLLEKSRICSQAKNERNYHVFYYLLAGATDREREAFNLLPAHEYHYLNQSGCYTLEGEDECYEFSRLKQSMEMVGFSPEKQKRLFAVLSAVLLLGNVEFQPKKSTYHHDESVLVKNCNLVKIISSLLRVREETLMAALVSKRARASGETLVMNYRMAEAIAARDAMAKCLYGALFDWIVLQVNHALLSKKETVREHLGYSIGVLDIFGFEDFNNCNSFEQFCINYANEHLQYYFNQHVFKYEQEEYKREGIRWTNIEFKDNTGCLQLIEGKPSGLLCILDDQCNFPGATNETLLQKFNSVHKENEFYEVPQKRESAFIIRHYAGKVKYQVSEFREKNLDLMRQDIVSVLKSSSMAFVRELVGLDPVAVFRWAILRAFFRAYFAFMSAGERHRNAKKNMKNRESSWRMLPKKVPNDTVIRRNRSFCPHVGAQRGLKNLQTMKTLARHTHGSFPSKGYGGRKQPMTVTAQFQISLHSLKVTLNQANPFFIRCIKSNSEKVPNKFDDEIVQRQLRYTGMLETVRIRQAGFNVRLTFEEFIQLYRILLPRGLCSSQKDIKDFLTSLNLDAENYQIGQTKIFMRECEKVKLDYRLHQQIMASIITIQRWFRTVLERRNFLQLRRAVVKVQSYCRMFLAQRQYSHIRLHHLAATYIQKMWRGYRTRKWYKNLRQGVIHFQAVVRGNFSRQRFRSMAEERQKAKEREGAVQSRDADSCSAQSTDEAFLSKESSQEDLDERIFNAILLRDSDESSGIQEDSESESMQSEPALPTIMPGDIASSLALAAGLHHHSSASLPAVPTHASEERKNLGNQLTSEDKENDKVKTKLSLKRGKYVRNDANRKPEVKSKSVGMFTTQKSMEEPQKTDEILGTAPKNPFHKATQHIKAFVSGTKRDTKYSSQDVPDSDSDTEDTLTHESCSTTPSMLTLESIASSNSSSIRPMVAPYKSSAVTERSREERRELRKQVISERQAVRIHVQGQSSSITSLAESVSSARKESLRSTCSLESPASVSGSQESFSSEWKYDGSYSSVFTTTSTEHGRDSLIRRESVPIEYSGGPQRNSAPEIEANNRRRRSHSTSEFEPDPFALDSLPADITATYKKNHIFTRLSKVPKGEICFACAKIMHAFFNQAYVCQVCNKKFHSKCVESGVAKQKPCVASVLSDNPRRQKYHKHKVPYEKSGKFSLTGTSEFRDSTDKIISDVRELHLMQDFMAKKIYKMEADNKQTKRKESEVDRIFHAALREFKDNLLSTYSAATHQGNDFFSIKYKDLIANFAYAMDRACHDNGASENFPVTMCINAFRGFLNEFVTSSRLEEKPSKVKRRKEKKKKGDDAIVYLGHVFYLTMMNIPTACEICSSFFMWPIERGIVCQLCKFTCHKKCYQKVTHECGKDDSKENVVPNIGNKVFGVSLCHLVNDQIRIPVVFDRIVTTIEMHGLYTEGLYRKSAVTSKVRELKKNIEGNLDSIDFEGYPVHVLAAVVKCFLRDMPEPLLTFEKYEEILRAAGLTLPQDRVATLINIIKKLPKPNYDMIERLLFHLARVALHEDVNRMSANAIAVVIAPCVLRTNVQKPAQETLEDINKQIICIETIIQGRMQEVRATLADIDHVDNEFCIASRKLSSLRSSKTRPAGRSEQQLPVTQDTGGSGSSTDEEQQLANQMKQLKAEKALLTSVLPSLTRSPSDDDLLSTDMDMESPAGSLDDLVEETDASSKVFYRMAIQRPTLNQVTSKRTVSIVQVDSIHRSDRSVVSMYPFEVESDEDAIMV